jgi:hypothetical protein
LAHIHFGYDKLCLFHDRIFHGVVKNQIVHVFRRSECRHFYHLVCLAERFSSAGFRVRVRIRFRI